MNLKKEYRRWKFIREALLVVCIDERSRFTGEIKDGAFYPVAGSTVTGFRFMASDDRPPRPILIGKADA